MPRLPRMAEPRRRPRPRRSSSGSTSTRSRAPASRRCRRRRPKCEPFSKSSASSDTRRRPATVACTSTCDSSHGGTPTTCAERRSPPLASSSDATPISSPRRGGRKSGASGSSSTSTRTRRTRPCSARGRCGHGPARQVSTPLHWDEIDKVHPDELTIATLPARIEAAGDPWASMNDNPQSIEPLLAMYRARSRERPHGRAVAAGLSEAARRAAPGRPQPRPQGVTSEPAHGGLSLGVRASCSSRWWRWQRSSRFDRAVSPPSTQCFLWWTSHQAGGRSQPGATQWRSRAITARRSADGIVRVRCPRRAARQRRR